MSDENQDGAFEHVDVNESMQLEIISCATSVIWEALDKKSDKTTKKMGIVSMAMTPTVLRECADLAEKTLLATGWEYSTMVDKMKGKK